MGLNGKKKKHHKKSFRVHLFVWSEEGPEG